jgi:hypothetical protein
LIAFFQCAHPCVVAEGIVATHPRRLFLRRQTVDRPG